MAGVVSALRLRCGVKVLLALAMVALLAHLFIRPGWREGGSTPLVGKLLSRIAKGPSATQTLGNLFRSNTKPSETNVLLLGSMGRSGSSFLGGLLTSRSGVFYVFEPLHRLDQGRRVAEDVARESFKQILTCNFSGRLLEAFKAEPAFNLRSPRLPRCRPKKKNVPKENCLDPAWLKSACERHPAKVIKTIRASVETLEPLLRDPQVNLKVIHILRDPRAAIISQRKEEWGVDERKSCARVEEDLRSGRKLDEALPGRYMAVRYEDICENPREMAHLIFTFLGYKELPPSTIRFLEKSTSSNDGQTFGTRRNSTAQQQKWRLEITAEQLQEIESVCSSAITAVGFNLFGDIERTRNLSVPLYNLTSASSFFPYYDGR